MKNKSEIKNEISRLEEQITTIRKTSKKENWLNGFKSVIRIITLESNINALEWVLDKEDKVELGFNLKDK